MATVIAYCRVSTPGQAAEGVSLDAQRERIAAWCVANGHDLAAVHVDAGLSGGKAHNRPALQRALDAVVKARGILCVYSLSRLARSTKDTLAIAERLDRAGADLASLSERLDTSSAAGKMIFRLLAVLAEFERDLASERTTAAMSHLRSQGRRVARHAPYGCVEAEGGRWAADPEEERGVALMVELRAAGLSFRAIATELEQRGFRGRNGGAVSPSTVRLALRRHAA